MVTVNKAALPRWKSRHRGSCALLLSLLGSLLLPIPALAHPGDLDTSFNHTGKFVSNFSTEAFVHQNGVAVQKDGKVVVAFDLEGPGDSGSSFAMTRLNS